MKLSTAIEVNYEYRLNDFESSINNCIGKATVQFKDQFHVEPTRIVGFLMAGKAGRTLIRITITHSPSVDIG